MTRLSITVSDHPRFSVVSLTGDLDKLSAPPLEEAFTALLTRGHVRIIIDTTDLGFCDSSGVWVLLATMRRTYEQNGWLRLAGVNGFLGRLLELTGLRAAFPIDRDVNESLRQAAEGRGVPVSR
ncbi:anti-anti-sigma factor [Streptosporangium album]|uniref:Anti-sigma factor antagonist n=1 Tax=Streptosporangium album TaxID=47479 RepID=A0A7W7W6T6_9ACTN|nr:STAS domain-containing protein [Streptosporangium album]MBB4936597.1 anti-anti-sigma factor [Streptosporangium album]